MKTIKRNLMLAVLGVALITTACENYFLQKDTAAVTKTNSDTINVNLSGTITVSPASGVTINTELTATYSGNEPVSYQWKKDGIDVGANSKKYTPTTAGTYTVTVSAEGYNPKTSAVVDVSDPSLPNLSGTITISHNSGVTVDTELTATYSGGETVNYRWEKDGIPVGTNSSKYTPTEPGSYTVTVRAEGYNHKTSAAVYVIAATDYGTPGFAFEFLYSGPNAGTYRIWAGSITSGDVIIPATHNGRAITEIGVDYDNESNFAKESFQWLDITSISIPDTVKVISKLAFLGCYDLSAINVDPNNQNYSSEQGVLYNKNKTTLIHYPAEKTGVSFNVPDSVTVIEEFSFQGSANLASVFIPDSVKSIGDEAFRYCEKLESVSIGNGVTSIGNWAFGSCNNLESVTFTPTSKVASIGDGAFAGCDLTSIDIPDSVTSIEHNAFYGCTSLTSVTFKGTIPSDRFTDNAFDGDLRDKFYATDSTNGTAGTYKTTAPVSSSSTWTKQP
ncbi:leucine-rich repeat domain-containing protein [Treponema sp. R80B11-R83G3]